MKNILFIIFLASPAFLIPFSSCHQTIDVKCDTMSLVVYGAGFEFTAGDSVQLVKYKQDNLFDVTVDSAWMRATRQDNDTFEIIPSNTSYSAIPPGFFIIPGYDYKILFRVFDRSIPYTIDTKTFLITNIVSNGRIDQVFNIPAFDDKTRPRCYNQIQSCSINGVTTVVQTTLNQVFLQ